MHVKKFEANSLDEAFKKIKKELGPDAIILKTVTNKGVKGIFSKSKIEITAAISEKNYEKKAKVDSVLDKEQKQKFYSSSSNVISHMIDNYSENNSDEKKNVVEQGGGGYGNIALNRSVKTKKNIPGLDAFLGNDNRDSKEEDENPAKDDSLEVKKISHTEDSYKELYELQKQRIEGLEKKLYQLKKDVLEMDRKGLGEFANLEAC